MADWITTQKLSGCEMGSTTESEVVRIPSGRLSVALPLGNGM